MYIVQGGHAVTVKGWKKLGWSQHVTAEWETSSVAWVCVWGSGSEHGTNVKRHGMLDGEDWC